MTPNPLLSTARHKLGVLGVSFNRGHPQLPHLEDLGANFLGKRLTPLGCNVTVDLRLCSCFRLKTSSSSGLAKQKMGQNKGSLPQPLLGTCRDSPYLRFDRGPAQAPGGRIRKGCRRLPRGAPAFAELQSPSIPGSVEPLHLSTGC